MHVVVLGTGMIGTTVVKEIAEYPNVKKVTAIDGFSENINKCKEKVNNPKVEGKAVNLDTEEDIYPLLMDADVAVACLPHSLSLPTIRASISAGCHLVDLVGPKFEEKMRLDHEAKSRGVVIVPGCGVAPGITNFLAAQGIEMLDEAEEAVMICGGIPKHPVPLLWYQVVFRLESLLGLYTRPALAAENGELVQLPPLSQLETLQFPDPVGECEAVVTDAHSTAYTLKDKVDRIYEKTVRYAGHWSKMSVLAELGFLNEEEVNVEGVSISPKKVAEKVLEPSLQGQSKEDITVLRVTTKGKKDGEERTYTWEMIDSYDQEREITSMAKTTAMPAMLLANWILEGKVSETGIVPVENIVVGDRFEPFLEELYEKGIKINHYQS